MIYLVIGLAGVVGSVLRYIAGEGIKLHWMTPFPIDTLLINLSGSFLLGMLYYYLTCSRLSPLWYKAIGTGLLGSFTTFSAFSMETVVLLQQGLEMLALLYFMTSLWGGLLLSSLGYYSVQHRWYRLPLKGKKPL
ncbi:MAG TPA: fluoride efflux transporter CrcB [Bacilli bacterium]